MSSLKRKSKFYFLSFIKHDFKASITVFFVALPLCLGISLASGAPIYSGLIAGIVGGLVVSVLSGSELSVSGPAAGLTAICAAAIGDLGGFHLFVLAVMLAGLLQILLGVFKLGGFTSFVPSSVIKGMLVAIGLLLISKQLPLLIGYNQPDFWTNELVNIITFNHVFSHLLNVYNSINWGAVLLSGASLLLLIFWKKLPLRHIPFLPPSFVVVLLGALGAQFFEWYLPQLALMPTQFVSIPGNIFAGYQLPDFVPLFSNYAILKTAVVIAFVATLETLLSLEAIDKLDPYDRVSPQNRELVAQGCGNFLSGLLGGLPITAVIVRSSANAEAGGKTRLSGFFHGLWLLVMVLAVPFLLNKIPYCVLAAILILTGFNLAKPSTFLAVWKLGREQFMPFAFTIGAVLFTDLLIGVAVGFLFASYYIIRNTYRAGYYIEKTMKGHIPHYRVDLSGNVSFLNKKNLKDALDQIPNYSIVEIDGTESVYIDFDILEIISQYKKKAHNKHIELHLKGIQEVQTMEVH